MPLTVCDAYIRRGSKQARVIGTLLGTATDNIIEVTSCFSVPHSESLEQVSGRVRLLAGTWIAGIESAIKAFFVKHHVRFTHDRVSSGHQKDCSTPFPAPGFVRVKLPPAIV